MKSVEQRRNGELFGAILERAALIASKLPPARRSPVMSSGYAHSEESAEWGIKHLYADPDADFSKSSVSFNFPVTDISIRAVRGFAQTDFELLVIQHGRYPSNAIFLKALRKQLKKLPALRSYPSPVAVPAA